MSTPGGGVAFLDIDNTLVFAEREFGQGTGPRTCVDSTAERRVAFATDQTLKLLVQLGDAVVPTTARSAEQLARMTLFSTMPSVAIIAAGATVLVDGVADIEWRRILSASIALSAPVHDVVTGLNVRARSVSVREGLLIVLTYDAAQTAAHDAVQLAESAREQRWTARTDGRRTYLHPDALSKAAAAEYVARLWSATTTAAAGDSALDLGLLEWADYAIAPAGSWAASVGRPGIDVTRQQGPRAAEEICARILLALAAQRKGK
ncbi:hypothetical protein GCM10007382_19750 [Salinibacterium xinjiangense]|uniref:Hydroxymethylpyrimidine pyrophosphatase n=1 Tax=Salinibacterium xinjiangense TaxID=386302 RepID=A0A2C8YTB3_9MICO|nr:hypothetical protein [Salinibacterium xinjiangense]GGK99872.1 hypothetical protein GCM10007382_19750 [Salinibacterium xinjiangense]SOE53932.1 Hydroxymethylpyrimidine pyrophosphatase [Salinibacterium xinjiangense]